jgi:hypothetical protein
MSIAGDIFPPPDILFRGIFHLAMTAKTQDQCFVTSRTALLNSIFYFLIIGKAE